LGIVLLPTHQQLIAEIYPFGTAAHGYSEIVPVNLNLATALEVQQAGAATASALLVNHAAEIRDWWTALSTPI
jgi:hypothetical protein